MRKTLPILSILCAVAFLFGETTAAQKKKTGSKAVTGSKTTSGSKTVSKKTVSKKSISSKKAARKPAAPTWRSAQRAPTPERYKEIQQALASKGYMEGKEPTGVWDDSSVSALKKFQQDQNLEPSGKLDSLSLIALGLGPKHQQSALASPPPREPQP